MRKVLIISGDIIVSVLVEPPHGLSDFFQNSSKIFDSSVKCLPLIPSATTTRASFNIFQPLGKLAELVENFCFHGLLVPLADDGLGPVNDDPVHGQREARAAGLWPTVQSYGVVLQWLHTEAGLWQETGEEKNPASHESHWFGAEATATLRLGQTAA